MSESNEQFIQSAQEKILGTYKRFPVVFKSGSGSTLTDIEGTTYLDMTGGIAVNALGHSHPKMSEAICKQASSLLHVSNLYHSVPQTTLAKNLITHCGDSGQVFFCNSGAEANECLIKLARRFGCKNNRRQILTARNSFHGRTMATLSATGKPAIQEGFEPLLPGFSRFDFNDIESVKAKINNNTAAVIIEGIQGESGIVPATSEFLIELRKLCTNNNILLLVDAVQCGMFRTGKFHSFETITGKSFTEWSPDAISFAKSLGGGLPIGACWISDSYAEHLPAGTHGSTFGGNLISATAANTVFDVIREENLVENIVARGEQLLELLRELQAGSMSHRIKEVRGMGLMIGIELQDMEIPEELSHLSVASYACYLAFKKGLLLVPAGTHVVRFLPAYNVTSDEIASAISLFKDSLE